MAPGTLYHFDLYSVTNTLGATAPFFINLTLDNASTGLPFSVAYLGTRGLPGHL